MIPWMPARSRFSPPRNGLVRLGKIARHVAAGALQSDPQGRIDERIAKILQDAPIAERFA
ncbi:MAG TPA: hypothetical protein VGV18_03225 [Verrucomicrobiae bacterium]|nr:hypothetical protein [Verrucomicrobiae bacterium]